MGLRNGLDIKVTRYRTRNKIMIFNFAFCLISVMVHHQGKYQVHSSTVPGSLEYEVVPGSYRL